MAQTELDLARRHQAEATARAEEDMARLTGAFATLSQEALAKNNEQFLALADTGSARRARRRRATWPSASRRSRSCCTR